MTNVMDEIMEEILLEEKKEEEKRKEIIANGCPHTEKEKRIGRFSKVEYLECKICGKQFTLDGIAIN